MQGDGSGGGWNAPPPPPPPPPPPSGATPLPESGFRPLRPGEIISLAFKHFGQNAGMLFATSAILSVPLFLTERLLLHRFIAVPVPPSQPATQAEVSHYLGQVFGSLWKTYLIGLAVSVIVSGLISAVLVPAIARVLLDRPWGPGESLRYGVDRAGRVIWVVLIQLLLVTAGLICLVIPGLILSAYTATAVPVCLLEDQRGTKAIRRSFDLVRHNWWHTFGTTLLIGLIVGAIGGFVSGFIGGFFGAVHVSYVVIALVDSLVVAFLTPLGTLVSVLLYTDLRSRLEGLSFEQLAAGLA
jgi:hypothetical protein